MNRFRSLSCILILAMIPFAVFAGDEEEKEINLTLKISQTELTLEVGKKILLTGTVLDEKGNEVQRDILFFSRDRRDVKVTPSGMVTALKPGSHELIAMVPADPERTDRRAEPAVSEKIQVTIPEPPLEEISFKNMPKNFYAGTRVTIQTKVMDTIGAERLKAARTYKSSKDSVAEFVGGGQLILGSPGKAKLTATADDISTSVRIHVVENPIKSLTLTPKHKEVRTGDVIAFEAKALDASGKQVPDAPVIFSVNGQPFEKIVAPGASAMITDGGQFVAERSGEYTVIAVTGSHTAMATVTAKPREVRRSLELVGRGKVHDQHTSDLWVWEAPNGRDYAITGTWGANGHAKIWDVTDPEAIALIDTVRVDARTVNDVKVSEDGRLAVITREGASDRKNGFVILDVSEPDLGVRIVGTYNDQLHGGVHNVFIYQNHVFALSDGTRYDIINIEDPAKPYRVGRVELESEGHSIHDVWVHEGVAYSSNWDDGVVAMDVGGGGKGGSFSNPVELGRCIYPSGWNHAAYPYRSKSTGKFYMFAGDEAFPYGLNTEPNGEPNRAAGWIHVFEWDNWDEPKEVARFFVPESGTHNFWIEDDILYVAMYNGGVRVVDVSGELVGDLYRQGRQIAEFIPNDSESFMPNAPFTWGPQPYKGHLFISDWNSGLWALKLVDPEKPLETGEPQ